MDFNRGVEIQASIAKIRVASKKQHNFEKIDNRLTDYQNGCGEVMGQLG